MTGQMARGLCDATIIQGFPTQKRPPFFPGLELGLGCMLDLVGASWPPIFENGRVVIKGCWHTLELDKYTQNVLLWHIVHPDPISCSFSECPSRNEHDTSFLDIESQIHISASGNRHIIANLEFLGVPVVNTGEWP